MRNSDTNVTIARLQKEASERLLLPADKLIFDFGTEGEDIRLDLITINPRHDESFLFHSVQAADKVACLETMIEVIRRQNQEKRSYTVQWSVHDSGELHTSYFRARNIHEVLDKFGYGRELSDYTIYSIILNPIT